MESTEPPKDEPTTQDSSDKPDTETTKSDPLPSVAHCLSESEPPKTHYDIACRPEKDWWEKWKPLVEIVGVVLLGVYTIFTIYMSYANRDAANAAELAANTASIALANSQSGFKLEQRPYLVTEPLNFAETIAPDKQIRVNITYTNIGRTPADKVVANFHLAKFHAGMKSPEGIRRFANFIDSKFANLQREDAQTRREFAPYPNAEQDVAPSQFFFGTTKDEVALSQKEFQGPFVTGEITLYCTGLMTYTDSSNGVYKTEFCYFSFGADPKIWHTCDVYNIIK
jgi:hypothetical protein